MYNVFSDQSHNAKHLPMNSNSVNYSMFKQFACRVPFRTFSLKYVVQGCEHYTVNGQRFEVGAGQYLLANQFAEGQVLIDSRQTVKGICIDVANDLLSEVVASHRRPDTPTPDLDLDVFFRTPDFLEASYSASQTATGQVLLGLGMELSKNPFAQHEFSRALYFSLAEGLVADHALVFKQLQAIPSVKSSTRKDLFRRVGRGKAFIDEAYLSPLDVAMVASESNLSEYHFFRLFKSMMGISPYKYMLQKRLTHAAFLIRKGNEAIAEIAEITGFSDIHAFSKSFKSHFGIAPSKYGRAS